LAHPFRAVYYPRVELPPELLNQLLRRWPVGRLASVSGAAAPHVVPIVFCPLEGVIYSPLDGKRKSTTHLKRFQNIAANPAVCLLLDAYHADWERLWWVRIDGRADRMQPPADVDERIRAVLFEKYPQYQQMPSSQSDPTWMRVQPGRCSAWTQSGDLAVIGDALAELN
jgi:PPOX class probable F420-dependent enzyme